jgi:hypothetical protein
MWVEFKCPICGKDLDDDKSMANFMVCNESSHGTLRFFTGDGCFFTSNEKVAEELVRKGKRVHVVDPTGPSKFLRALVGLEQSSQLMLRMASGLWVRSRPAIVRNN